MSAKSPASGRSASPRPARIDEILAARPDCLTFHGVWPDIELYERVLEAGINVVTTADWVTGHHRDTNHRRNGTRESDDPAGRVRARQLDVLRHRHEPRAWRRS